MHGGGRAGTLAVVLCVLAGVLAPSASAGTWTRDGTVLRYSEPVGSESAFDVSHVDDRPRVRDALAGELVTCAEVAAFCAPFGGLTAIDVELADGADHVVSVASYGAIAVELTGGDGDDTLVLAGDMPASVDAGAGDDYVAWQPSAPGDGTTPDPIDCGPGDDTLLAWNTNVVATGCEHVLSPDDDAASAPPTIGFDPEGVIWPPEQADTWLERFTTDPVLRVSHSVSGPSLTDHAYTCQVDDGAAAPCLGLQPLTGLGDGFHRVRVRASYARSGDVVLIGDQVLPFVLDRVAPGPAHVTVPQYVTASIFEPDVVELDFADCAVDDVGGGAMSDWYPCDGAFELPDGDWDLLVRLFDEAGNLGPVTTHRFTVDTVAPGRPAFVSNGPCAISPCVLFRGNAESSVVFVCSIDSSPPGPCESGALIGGLAIGEHWVSVYARDLAGNLSVPSTLSVWMLPPGKPGPAVSTSLRPVLGLAGPPQAYGDRASRYAATCTVFRDLLNACTITARDRRGRLVARGSARQRPAFRELDLDLRWTALGRRLARARRGKSMPVTLTVLAELQYKGLVAIRTSARLKLTQKTSE